MVKNILWICNHSFFIWLMSVLHGPNWVIYMNATMIVLNLMVLIARIISPSSFETDATKAYLRRMRTK